MTADMVLLGEIGRPHGVRGLLRVRSFTAEPDGLTAYGPLTDETGGKTFLLELLAPDLARIHGVNDRGAAARLTGTRLFVPRGALPVLKDPDEFYLADLEGLEVATADGRSLGRVLAVQDHGAGAFLVLQGPPELMIPFTKEAVPLVDIGQRRLVVSPPSEAVIGQGTEA